MSRKKGLSVEEKRQKMLEVFAEKQDFFQLKELEKICPKEKGISPMSVKEILQSLVDDDLVNSEKIGSSIYFWSFPSEGAQKRTRRIDSLNENLKTLKDKRTTLLKNIKTEESKRVECEHRTTLLKEINNMEKELESLNSELSKYQDCDPESLEKKKSDCKIATDATNRWTDNLFSTKSWLKRKMPHIEEATLDKHFGIPSDIDYIE